MTGRSQTDLWFFLEGCSQSSFLDFFVSYQSYFAQGCHNFPGFSERSMCLEYRFGSEACEELCPRVTSCCGGSVVGEALSQRFGANG